MRDGDLGVCDVAQLRDKLKFCSPSSWSYRVINIHAAEFVAEPHSFSASLVRRWSSDYFEVPEDCIKYPSIPIVDKEMIDESVDLLISLAYIQLSPLRPFLHPLTEDDMWARMSKFDECNPDFYLQPQALGCHHIRTAGLIEFPSMAATEPTLLRILDILRCDDGMVSISQAIINIFAGLPEAGLRMNATNAFPWSTSTSTRPCSQRTFALAPQCICPTLPATLQKYVRCPLTLLDPAVLFGAIEIDGDFDLTAVDQGRLSEDIQPHLEALVMALHLRHLQGLHFPDSSVHEEPHVLPTWVTIFAIIIKRGVVHILSHTPVWQGEKWEFHSALVDSLSFPLQIKTNADLHHRMRLAMALLTLQKHARLLSTVWNGIVWPAQLLDQQQAVRDERTGIRSPCPTDNLTLDAENPARFDPPNEEPTEEQRLATVNKSKARVRTWLESLPTILFDSSDGLLFPRLSFSGELHGTPAVVIEKSQTDSWPILNTGYGTIKFPEIQENDCIFLLPDTENIMEISLTRTFQSSDTTSHLIVKQLRDVTTSWIKFLATNSVAISEKYRPNHCSLNFSSISHQDLVWTQTITYFLQTLEECIARRRRDKKIRWIRESDTAIPAWPEPDFSFLSNQKPHDILSSQLFKVFLKLLRYPSFLEGGPEYGVDTMIADAIMHILDLPNVVISGFNKSDVSGSFLSTIDLSQLQGRTMTVSEYPMVVLNFTQDRESARREIARAAFPSVAYLLRIYHETNGYAFDRVRQRDNEGNRLSMNPQPERHFVYGVHCANGTVTVYVHFATLAVVGKSSESERRWCLHQGLVDVHYTHYVRLLSMPDERLVPDITLLQRWGLIVALFTLRRHAVDCT